MTDQKSNGPFQKFQRFEFRYLVTIREDNIHELAKFLKGHLDYSGSTPRLVWGVNKERQAFPGEILELNEIIDKIPRVTKFIPANTGEWWDASIPALFRERAKLQHVEQFNTYWG